MFNGLTGLLLCLVGAVSDDAQASQNQDRERLQQIASNLDQQIEVGKLPRRNLTVTAYKNSIIVTGRIEAGSEARPILDAITAVEGIESIQLNLGIGREPPQVWPYLIRPEYDTRIWRRDLKWDDGEWQLDFGSSSAGDDRED